MFFCSYIHVQYCVVLYSTLCLFTDKSLSPQRMFHNAASNIICQVVFGTRFDYEDEFIKVIVQCFTENAKISNGPWAMVSQSMSLPSNLAALS